VSVIIPVLNEERHLDQAVRMVLNQDYPGMLEVVLALGPSKDRTNAVAQGLTDADPRVRTVPSPSGKTPNALNAAIGAARHEVVARVDGHAEIPVDYLRVAVAELVDRVRAAAKAEAHEAGRARRRARSGRSRSCQSVEPRPGGRARPATPRQGD